MLAFFGAFEVHCDKGGEDSLLAARPGHQPGYCVALSGSELRREGDAREGRGRGGTDCAGNLHTPGCDARDGGGPHALAPRVERVNGPVGEPKSPTKILLTPQSW